MSKFDDPKVTPLPVKQQPELAYPVTWLADAKLALDTQPIVKGLIEPGAFVVIYGQPGSGKSFFTADLCQHIATGRPWRGRRVQRGLVVYVASEAGSSILRRFVAWRDNRLGEAVEALPLAILTRGPNLLASVEVEKLIETLAELERQAGLPLLLVVFDTLSRSMHGGDENKAEDMTMAVNAADRIRDRFKSATGFVHHGGKDPTKGPRGHSALFAAADLVIGIDNHTGTVEKVRDGVTGERFPFQLEPVEIGTDWDGEPVMTCLLNAQDQSANAARAEPKGKNQVLIYGPLRELIAESGQVMPGTSAIPQGVRATSVQELIKRVTPKFAGMPEWRVKARIHEALMGLQASGHISVHNDLVWLR